MLAVLGQKLTSAGSKRSVTRLVQTFGLPVASPIRGLKYLFPRPEVLARADLSKAGISNVHSKILRDLANSTIRRHLTFSTLRTFEQTVSQVGAACGIDETTASYLAMRAFGEPDTFSSGEPALRRRLAGLKTMCLLQRQSIWQTDGAHGEHMQQCISHNESRCRRSPDDKSASHPLTKSDGFAHWFMSLPPQCSKSFNRSKLNRSVNHDRDRPSFVPLVDEFGAAYLVFEREVSFPLITP